VTTTTTSATTFTQQWKTGRRVQEKAAPHRKGTIRTVRGTGVNAVITVGLDGWHLASFRPAQLALI